jgi:predicted 3-demethylubiquinone-9 3-methyltransferase (glyoxalase superfamily)
VHFDPSQDAKAAEHLDELWDKLAAGGKALMPLQEYPFSKHYGWIQDKFGVSWQLILTNPSGEPRPFIVPSLLFVGDVAGKADEAIDLYVSTFPESRRGTTARYPAGMEPDKEGSVMFADFNLSGNWLAAMDSAQKHEFAFSEAISLLVECADQAELDFYASRLSAVPEAEQCGWVKDKFGVSWQISPVRMRDMMREGTPEQVARVTKAFLPMKRFDLAKLEEAYRG